MTLPWRTLATAAAEDGALELRQRGGDYLIVTGGRVLVTSAARRSEEALATLACAGLPRARAPRLLVAGLGMGFTLRAALDALPAGARVDVAELSAAVVDWCRGPLHALTGGAVSDPRVHVIVDDVAHVIAAAAPASYHAILLDLYQGPYGDARDPCFGDAALARARAALAPGGVLAVWSEDAHPPFARRLAAAGFRASTRRAGRGGRAHIIYIGAI